MSLSLNKIFAHAGRDLLIRELALDSRNGLHCSHL